MQAFHAPFRDVCCSPKWGVKRQPVHQNRQCGKQMALRLSSARKQVVGGLARCVRFGRVGLGQDDQSQFICLVSFKHLQIYGFVLRSALVRLSVRSIVCVLPCSQVAIVGGSLVGVLLVGMAVHWYVSRREDQMRREMKRMLVRNGMCERMMVQYCNI
jgi:hypothetical protein